MFHSVKNLIGKLQIGNMLKTDRKMYRTLVVFYLFLVPFCGVSAEESTDVGNKDLVEGEERDIELYPPGNPVETAIETFETSATNAVNAIQQAVLPEEEITNLLDGVVPLLEHIIVLLKDPNNVYKFIEAKGIDRVILPHLQIDHTRLRTQLLKLTQLLFDVAPTTTSVVIPITVLDKLLDIFEDDDNLALKSRTMYILYAWLPDNPKVQARVMKLKGLDPFYDEMHKLDATVIDTQLKLLSKIIKEHIKARNNYQQKSKTDLIKLNLYKRIGLIERLSTDKVCHGLFNIFKSIWEDSGDNKGFLVPVFEIIMDVQPYCTDTLKGRFKAVDLLHALQKHVKGLGQNAKDYYEELGLNTTNLELVLQNYVDKLDFSHKDEF